MPSMKNLTERVASVSIPLAERSAVEGLLAQHIFNPYIGKPRLAHSKTALGRLMQKTAPTLSWSLKTFMGNRALDAIRIRHVPIGNNRVPTPLAEFESSDKRDFVSETFLLATAFGLGFPYSYANESNGSLVQNIFPVKKFAKLQSSKGSVELTAHTELSCTQDPPDFLLLLCLKRGKIQAYTGIISLEEVVRSLDSRVQKALRKKIYKTEIDPSMRRPGQRGIESKIFSVISRQYGLDRYQYDVDFTKSDHAEGADALGALRDAYRRFERRIWLQSGDLLVINNKRAAHTRGAFQPKFDTTDRWLQRMIVSRRPRSISIKTIV